RARRAPSAETALRQGGAVPAPVHVRGRADRVRRGEGPLGHRTALGFTPAGARRLVRALRRRASLLQSLYPPARAGDRAGLLAPAAPEPRGPGHPRGRARPGDARGAGNQRDLALHGRVHARLVSGRPRRRARDAREDDRTRHGCRDHRGGVHRRRDRRSGLVLGHVPRRADLRPGAVVRHPHLPAVLDLLGLCPDGCRADPAAVGSPRPAPPGVTVARMSRPPWGLLAALAALFIPALGSRFYTFVATDVAIMALFAVSLNLLLGYGGLVSFGHAAYFGI